MPDILETNPGEELIAFLMNLYPSNRADVFLQRVDYDLMADGELTELFYSSCINYVARRLITTAQHFYRQYPSEKYAAGRYQIELRKFLRDYTRYRDRDIDELIRILRKCLLAMSETPTDYQKHRIRMDAKKRDANCSYCGTELDYTKNSTQWNATTTDHFWPRAMGGLSETHNLKAACKACNNEHKKDFVDASDYHYEEMSLRAVTYDDYSSKEKNGMYELAIFAKTHFTCVVCKQPAERVGKLYVGRLEPGDSWHFLNLAAYCFKHKPRE